MIVHKFKLPTIDAGPFTFGDTMSKRTGTSRTLIEDWREWLRTLFPAYVSAPFAQRHADLWEWVEMLSPGVSPRSFVGIWPRGGAKSSSAELACVRIGARQSRRYIWYISRTQDKADKHVETIGSMLESNQVARYHPELASRKIGKYGASKGWRRSRLRTSSGLTIDALGLDVGSRGAKVEEARPDLMIFDDVDEKHDSFAITQKVIQTITTSLLPAGSNDAGVLFIQNLIHPDSIASMLVDGRADFLADRIVSGPFPAVDGLVYQQMDGKHIITGGKPSWEGQDLNVCQRQMIQWGLSAFLQEAQHDVERMGGVWDHIEFRHCKRADVPEIVRGAVWVDPAVTSTDESDSMGIQADGIGENGILYRFFSWEGITTPEDALKRAISKAIELGFTRVGVETDQGGDTWRSVYAQACQSLVKDADYGGISAEHAFPEFASDKAGAGYGSKVERNAKMLAAYEAGRVVHVEGSHAALEKALRRFPKKPLDLADSAFWGWQDLQGEGGAGGFAMSYTQAPGGRRGYVAN